MMGEIESLICYIFGVLAMPRLKLWIVRGENPIIQLLWVTGRLLFARFWPYPPIAIIGLVLLQGNENVESDQDFILLPLCMV